jgi:hypothetical protein
MQPEKASQLTLAHSQTGCQRLDVPAVERSGLDQSESTRDRIRASAPEREIGRRFRAAAQAGTKSRLLRRGRRGEETSVFALRRGRRAERPAIDAGRRDRDEQATVEAIISRLDGAIAGVVVHIHASRMPRSGIPVWRFSDFCLRAGGGDGVQAPDQPALSSASRSSAPSRSPGVPHEPHSSPAFAVRQRGDADVQNGTRHRYRAVVPSSTGCLLISWNAS